jgi:hypothetical protein
LAIVLALDAEFARAKAILVGWYGRALVPNMVAHFAAAEQGKQVMQTKHHEQRSGHVLQKLFSSYLCVEFLAHIFAHSFIFPTLWFEISAVAVFISKAVSFLALTT